MHSHVFITGMGRSGTTLVDKILGGFAGIQSFSQPLPLLYVHGMAEFLKGQGITGQRLDFPLSDQQSANWIDDHALAKWLETNSLSKEELAPVLHAMVRYSGQYFKPENPLLALENWTGGTFFGFVMHYLNVHSAAQPHILACKEVMAEAFLPAFLKQGGNGLLVIRDPRDVLASLIDTQTKAQAGVPRPLLWTARQWRKSIAYKHELDGNSGFQAMRYEDLVGDVDTHVQHWANWLVTPAPNNSEILMDDAGKTWAGNSSFTDHGGISAHSIGRHKNQLHPKMRAFLEALCFAEMQSLGYVPSIKRDDVTACLREGPPEDYIEREALAYYVYSQERRDEELARWDALTSHAGKYDATLFLFEDNFLALRRALAS